MSYVRIENGWYVASRFLVASQQSWTELRKCNSVPSVLRLSSFTKSFAQTRRNSLRGTTSREAACVNPRDYWVPDQ